MRRPATAAPAGPQPDAPSFAIQLPPPNVTGTLHMGHAFNQTIMDSLTRYHRMTGDNTLWVPGTDHAGIATQIVVERQLQEQRQSAGTTSGRKNFVARVWEWKEKSGNTITRQMRRMGDTVDWSREYFTMDDELSHGRHRHLRQAVRGRPDLPRQAAGQLGPGAQDRGERPRGGERGGRRLPLAHRLPAGGRLGLADGGHHAPRDHAGRRGRDGASGGRALPAPGRPARAAAAGRPR